MYYNYGTTTKVLQESVTFGTLNGPDPQDAGDQYPVNVPVSMYRAFDTYVAQIHLIAHQAP